MKRQDGKSANRKWAIDGYDVLALIGLGMLGYGLGLVSIPLALAVTGGLLVAVGVLGAWRKGGRQ